MVAKQSKKRKSEEDEEIRTSTATSDAPADVAGAFMVAKQSKKRKSEEDEEIRTSTATSDAPADVAGEDLSGVRPGKDNTKRSQKDRAAAAKGAAAAAEGEVAAAEASGADLRKAKKRKSASLPQEDEVGGDGLDKLLRLRSLLAPPGSGLFQPPQKLSRQDAQEPSGGGGAPDDATPGAEVSVAPAAELPKAPVEGPDWTSRYYVVEAADDPVPFEKLVHPLHPVMDRALRKAGFSSLFPIQAAVIPMLLRGHIVRCDKFSPYTCDVCIAAPTGQGKTLAYALPIVQSLLGRMRARVRALVLLPTRDLALQVFRVFEQLREGLGKGVEQISAQCLIGQKSFAEEKRSLKSRPPDVIVCTPGRLSDHFLGREGDLDLGALRWFVADEADRLLTQDAHRWLDIMERVCHPPIVESSGLWIPPPQKLLLSATMTWNPQKLARLKLNRPMFFISSKTGRYSTPKELKQHYVNCRSAAKPLSVIHLLALAARGGLGGECGENSGRVVVFCASVDTAHRLARLLQVATLLAQPESEEALQAEALRAEVSKVKAKKSKEAKKTKAAADADEEGPLLLPASLIPSPVETSGVAPTLPVAEFSSTLTQQERTSLLAKFRRGKVRCLVCSDVVARGIDIPEVQAVINYTAPEHLATYIHRAGRTARAGRVGHTFTLVPSARMPVFEKMLRQSADCSERLQKFAVPYSAKNTKQEWYSRSLRLLEECLTRESRGDLPPGRPLQKEDVERFSEAFSVEDT